MTWDELDYWQSEEWQTVQEKLDELDGQGILYCPRRQDIFRSFDAVSFGSVKVAFIGQDPYPDRNHSMGVAFAVPKTVQKIPKSLDNMFIELRNDLHDANVTPAKDLSGWQKQGVFLWNVYPTCLVGSPGSHHWEEYTWLTKEIVEKLDKQRIVFVFLGKISQQFLKYIDLSNYVLTSHPSPLSASKGFLGSRVYTTVNSLLSYEREDPIDWRL